MANKQNMGLLSSLGLTVPEDALYEQATNVAPNTAGMDALSAAAMRGRARGQAVGGLGAAAIGGLMGGLSKESTWREGAVKGVQDYRDRVIANAAGMQVEDLQDRRRVNAAMQSFRPTSKDPLMAEIETLDQIIATSNSPEVLRQATSRRAMAKQKYDENLRLNSKAADEYEAHADKMKRMGLDNYTILDGQGNPVKTVWGRGTADGNLDVGGKIIEAGSFAKGDLFDRNKRETETSEDPLGFALRRRYSSAELKEARAEGRTLYELSQGYGRVMSMLQEAGQKGDQFGWLATSGDVNRVVDQTIRNSSRILGSMFKDAESAEDQTKKFEKWARGTAKIGNYELKLPYKDAAANQRYRSWIIGLAYLEARAAEPSNRGLSDNDIENALKRLDAGSADPDVIMQNFAQRMADNYANFNRRAGMFTVDNYSQTQVMNEIYGPNLINELDQQHRTFSEMFAPRTTGAFGEVSVRSVTDPGGTTAPLEGPRNPGQQVEDIETSAAVEETKKLLGLK